MIGSFNVGPISFTREDPRIEIQGDLDYSPLLRISVYWDTIIQCEMRPLLTDEPEIDCGWYVAIYKGVPVLRYRVCHRVMVANEIMEIHTIYTGRDGLSYALIGPSIGRCEWYRIEGGYI